LSAGGNSRENPVRPQPVFGHEPSHRPRPAVGSRDVPGFGWAPTYAQSEDQVSFSAVYQGQFFANSGDGPAVTQNGGAFGSCKPPRPKLGRLLPGGGHHERPNIINIGSFSILGEDGSTIIGAYQGQMTAPDDSGMMTISATYTVTDGTGLFAGASGRRHLQRPGDVVTGNMSISFTGTISPPVPGEQLMRLCREPVPLWPGVGAAHRVY